MAQPRRRQRALFVTRKKRSKPKRHFDIRRSVLNSAIVILSLFLIAFIFSFSKKYTQKGVPVEVTFPTMPGHTKLAVEVYEQNPILDIEVEILNGCGEQGLAGNFSAFLRSHQVDVVRAENADHFEYNRTLLIQRNENFEALKVVSASLGFDLNDKGRILVEPDASTDVDITVIIGRDFNSIGPFSDFLKNQF